MKEAYSSARILVHKGKSVEVKILLLDWVRGRSRGDRILFFNVIGQRQPDPEPKRSLLRGFVTGRFFFAILAQSRLEVAEM